MQTTPLGKTGLVVSVAGLGCGGPSRLGLREGYGNTDADAVRLVRTAIDLGVTLIDTASGYGTEAVVGRAVRESGRRDKLVVSSKLGAGDRGRADYAAGIDASLAMTGLDHLDLYHVHGVAADELPHVMDQIVPALLDAKRAGKVRHLAISERFESEPAHAMFRRLLRTEAWSDVFEVAMVGFNLLNPSARRHVFPRTFERGIGTLGMFAVRRALTDPERRAAALAEMGQPADALDFLGDGAAITQAGYRFCRHEPGVDCVLFGTGSAEHLRQNVASLNAGPLPPDVLSRLSALFGNAESVSGS